MNKDIEIDFLTHLCYLKALSLVSTFKLCKECEGENIKQAKSVLSLLETFLKYFNRYGTK